MGKYNKKKKQQEKYIKKFTETKQFLNKRIRNVVINDGEIVKVKAGRPKRVKTDFEKKLEKEMEEELALIRERSKAKYDAWMTDKCLEETGDQIEAVHPEVNELYDDSLMPNETAQSRGNYVQLEAPEETDVDESMEIYSASSTYTSYDMQEVGNKSIFKNSIKTPMQVKLKKLDNFQLSDQDLVLKWKKSLPVELENQYVLYEKEIGKLQAVETTQEDFEYTEYLDKFPLAYKYSYGISHEDEWADFCKIYDASKPYIKIQCHKIINGCIPAELIENHIDFYPNNEMFKDFNKFISFTVYCGAEYAGASTVTPPLNWRPNSYGYQNLDAKFENIKVNLQTTTKIPHTAAYKVIFNDSPSVITIADFYKQAMKKKYMSTGDEIHDLNKWLSDKNAKIAYLKDIPGSLMDESAGAFNINTLDNIMTQNRKWISEDEGAGLRHSYLYFGEYGSVFADHVEDFCLMSVNFLHGGANKIWFVTSPLFSLKTSNSLRITRMQIAGMRDLGCAHSYSHKVTFTLPEWKKEFEIPCVKIIQKAGTFVITYCNSYHCGYSEGFSIAEATNFATNENWLESMMFQPRCSIPTMVEKITDETGKTKTKINGCKLGFNTNATPDEWFRNIQPTIFNKKKWNENCLDGYHPDTPIKVNGPEYSSCVRVGATLNCELPKYHIEDPRNEPIEIAYKILKVFRKEEDVLTIKDPLKYAKDNSKSDYSLHPQKIRYGSAAHNILKQKK